MSDHLLDKLYDIKNKSMAHTADETLASYKLKTVLSHLNMSTFDYDIARDTVYVRKENIVLPDFTTHWFLDGGEFYYLEALTQRVPELVRSSMLEASINCLTRIRSNVAGELIAFDVPIVYKDGKTKWTNFIIDTVIGGDGKPACAIGYCKDINQQKKEQYRIYKVAQTDALTGLRNRTTTIYKVDERIREDEGSMHFLAVLDLNKFKLANDLFGHSFGDLVLKNVADRIREVDDHETICCRTGGDEFMFFRICDSEEHAMQILTRLKNTIRHDIDCDGKTFHVEASVGFALQPQHGIGFDELFNKADAAMYYAKQNNADVPVMYDEVIMGDTAIQDSNCNR